MTDEPFTSRRPSKHQHNVMGATNPYDAKEYARGLLKVVRHRITTDDRGDIESVELALSQLIHGNGTWQQALKGMQELGFEGIKEVPRTMDDKKSGSTARTFTFDSGQFSFMDRDSHTFEGYMPAETITLKGEKNIDLIGSIFAERTAAEAQQATRPAGRNR